MTEEEFLERLKEDKWFKDPQELIDYRLPVVQYYLTNLTRIQSITPNGVVNSWETVIEYREQDFTLINQAFESIKEQFKGK